MKPEQIFKTFPKIDSYFQTSDGAQFFNTHDASAHAKNLKDKRVTEVKRPSKEAKEDKKEAGKTGKPE